MSSKDLKSALEVGSAQFCGRKIHVPRYSAQECVKFVGHEMQRNPYCLPHFLQLVWGCYQA